jgi:hypothetical protein
VKSKHVLILILIAIAGCDTSPAEPTATISFPDADPVTKIIPYHNGGELRVAIHGDVAQLIGPARATVSLDPAPGVSAPAQPITLYPGDGGLDGIALLTWPRGGDVAVHASVAGAFVPDETARLEKPDLEFHPCTRSDSGAQWVYSCCVDATMADGNLALHVDSAAFDDGTTDAALKLVPSHCDPARSAPGWDSHAAFRLISTGGNARTTAVFAPILPDVHAPLEFVVPAHVAPAVEINPISTVFGPLSIVEIDVHVTVSGQPAVRMQVTLQAVPPLPANTIVPSPVITDGDGHARAHFQMPASGPIEIDAIVGPTRSTRVFP